MGIDVDAFFGKSIITGSHENGIIALDKGTVDCAADWWNADNDSNLTRMVNKGMAKKDDFRIIFKTPILPGSPYAYLSSLPTELKKASRASSRRRPRTRRLSTACPTARTRDSSPVTHKDYQDIVEMIQFVDEMRKSVADHREPNH